MSEGAAEVVLSCEHAGNEVPPEYRHLFSSSAARAALASHRGWDPGAFEIARRLAEILSAPLLAQPVTRLLVECNRSLDHPALWSEFTRQLPEADRRDVLQRFWHPHRDAVRARVREAALSGHALHVGVHTFTPVWRGRARSTHIGVLYDPRREPERTIARSLRDAIARAVAGQGPPSGSARSGGLSDPRRVHLNRPYRGWTDGLTTTLRGELPPDRYVGLEIEVSQGLASHTDEVVVALTAGLRRALSAQVTR